MGRMERQMLQLTIFIIVMTIVVFVAARIIIGPSRIVGIGNADQITTISAKPAQ